MPVHRFRDVRDVPPPPAEDPHAPAFLDRVFDLWAFARSAVVAPLHPPGVQRFVSIEAADAAREAAILARMRSRRSEP
ncbi:hypothetical protein BH23DEI1_BH23DEI1_05390 [soil metagenome]